MAGGHVWQRGVCMAKRGHVWQEGVCIAGGHAWQGVCVAGEMVTAVDSTHPTGMRSCFSHFYAVFGKFMPKIG